MDKLEKNSMEYKLVSELVSDAICTYTRGRVLPDIQKLKQVRRATMQSLTESNWGHWLDILSDTMKSFGMNLVA